MSPLTGSLQTAPVRSNRQERGFVGRAATRFWPAADGTSAPRASIVLMPGRGENATGFERTAVRLAADGYDVTFLGAWEQADVALAEARRPGVPFVLFGSDTGALRALNLAGSPALRPDALVLLGLPLLHRPFAGEVPADLPPRALPDLPTLLIHGRRDEVSPHHLVRIITRTARSARLETVPGGHRILWGPDVRLVAALTVLFVESLLRGDVGESAAGARLGTLAARTTGPRTAPAGTPGTPGTAVLGAAAGGLPRQAGVRSWSR